MKRPSQAVAVCILYSSQRSCPTRRLPSKVAARRCARGAAAAWGVGFVRYVTVLRWTALVHLYSMYCTLALVLVHAVQRGGDPPTSADCRTGPLAPPMGQYVHVGGDWKVMCTVRHATFQDQRMPNRDHQRRPRTVIRTILCTVHTMRAERIICRYSTAQW